MKTLKSFLAAVAITLAATAGAQTLKMEHQTAGVTTYVSLILMTVGILAIGIFLIKKYVIR